VYNALRRSSPEEDFATFPHPGEEPMRRLVTYVSTISLVSIAFVLSMGVTGRIVHAAPPPQILHLTANFDDFFTLDFGDPGDSLGDEFGAAVSWLQNGQQVATVGFTCTTTRLQPQKENFCVLSARFANGVLTAQTIYDESSTAPTDWAITGGTGPYHDAGGVITFQPEAITVRIDHLTP
jgi:Allene oxide cyclase barrel like domain